MPLLTSPGIISIGLLAKGSGVNWTFIVLALVATGTIGGIVIYVDRLRTQKLEELARALGYTFRRKPTSADRELPIGCYLAETGRDPVISNVLEVARTDEPAFTVNPRV